jgi:hypothetical protein
LVSRDHYPKLKRAAHPHDCSVMAYRGHAVLRTLIRCHFSPAETTGGQYIYSGSADGKIHVRFKLNKHSLHLTRFAFRYGRLMDA